MLPLHHGALAPILGGALSVRPYCEHVFAMPRAKVQEQAAARRLRSEGLPYKRIAAMLRVGVASVYSWTRDIELTEEQKELNLRGPDGPLSRERVRRRAAAWSATCRRRRERWQDEGRRAARLGDPLHQAGCMLYWAEGARERNRIQFANSDPHMVVLFRRFLTDALAIEVDAITLAVNVYTNNGLSIEEIELHWLDVLELPTSCVRAHTVNVRPASSSGRGAGRLPYGVCTLRVNSTRMVQHIFGAIQEYAGFDEPAWLE